MHKSLRTYGKGGVDKWTVPAAALRRSLLTLSALAFSQASHAAPVITAVVDAAAYTANIAQGSVFVVKGTNLCPSGTVYGSVPYSAAPLNGVKLTFTPAGGGGATDMYMVYTYGAGSVNQLAAILPSTVPSCVRAACSAPDRNVSSLESQPPTRFFRFSVPPITSSLHQHWFSQKHSIPN